MLEHPKTNDGADRWDNGVHSFLRTLDDTLASFMFGQRRGCNLAYASAATITVAAGTIWFPRCVRRNLAAVTLNLSTAGDRESGVSEGASAWYYVYAKPKTDSLEGFQAFFSTTAPTEHAAGRHPTQKWAYLGAVYNDASSNITQFFQHGSEFTRWAELALATSTTTTGFAWTPVSVLRTCPPNMLCKCLLRADAAGGTTADINVFAGYVGLSTGMAMASAPTGPASTWTRDTQSARIPADGSGNVEWTATNGSAAPTSVYVQLSASGFVDPFLP